MPCKRKKVDEKMRKYAVTGLNGDTSDSDLVQIQFY